MEEHRVKDRALNLYRRPDFSGIVYSDGDAAELHILESVKKAADRSIFSVELARAIKDWPSEYHLSRQRHCLVRPLGIRPGDRILELGCGCGAVTRYLGELGASVTGVEGSLRRAEIAAERCRDLPNVKIIAEDLLRFQSDEEFDWVLLIGVLEYAPTFSDESEPALSYLRRAAGFLTPGGCLVVAIENKFGLKYFNGGREDHVGIPFYGVQGLYGSKEARTFGKRELEGILKAADLTSIAFWFPFPDYKLPRVILSEAGLADSTFDPAELLATVHARDYGASEFRLFDEPLAFREAARNGLIGEFSNSFLVVASKDHSEILPERPLAVTYAVQRLPQFTTQTRLDREGEVIRVRKQWLFADLAHEQAFGNTVLRHVPKDSAYFAGQLTLWRLIEARARHGSLNEIVAALVPWFEYLLASASSAGKTNKEQRRLADFTLDGHFADLTPFNLIEAKESLRPIDLEWQIERRVPLGWVVTRSIFFCLSYPGFEEIEIRIVDVIEALCARYELQFVDSEIAEWLELERQFQSAITDEKSGGFLLTASSRRAPPLAQELVLAKDQLAEVEKKAAEYVYHLERMKRLFFWKVHEFLYSVAQLIVSPFARSSRAASQLTDLSLIHFVRHGALDEPLTETYEEWINRYDSLNDRERAQVARRIASLARRPKISVIMPVYNTELALLRTAIDSVRSQFYPDWELCISDDASTLPGIRDELRKYVETDKRIRILLRDSNVGTAANSNSALGLATGEFVALLDSDDVLSEDALYWVAEEINARPEADLIFSDEDKIDASGRRFGPYFKPDWNQALILSQNLFSHLGVYRRSLVEAVGGFRLGFEGSQDHDLVLRCADATDISRIRHVPHILYHSRAISEPVAPVAEANSHAWNAGARAIDEHLLRKGIAGKVRRTHGNFYQVNYETPREHPKISIIMPSGCRLELLRPCLTRLLKRTSYPDFEVLLAVNEIRFQNAEQAAYLREIEQIPKVRILVYPNQDFNFSWIINWAAKQANGSIFCLMNDDIEIITTDWLEKLVARLQLERVGAVGVMLYYPDNTIQHAGVILGIGGIAAHVFMNLQRSSAQYDFSRAGLEQDLSCVTAACMAVRRKAFEELNGLDERLAVAFNDVDFCIRLREKGWRIIWTPEVEHYHQESATIGRHNAPHRANHFEDEMALMRKLWGPILDSDPFHNPNLSLRSTNPTFAFPPRTAKADMIRGKDRKWQRFGLIKQRKSLSTS